MNETLKELHGIAWLFPDEYDESVLQGVTTNKIFEYVKRIDKLPIVSGDIYFSNDVWDFNSVTLKRVPKRKSTYDFTKVDVAYKEPIKFFTLVKLWEDKDKIQTIYSSLGNIKDFLDYLISNYIYSLEYVSFQTITKYFDTKTHLAPTTYHRYKTAINDFFQFYSNNCKKFDWDEISKFLSKVDSQAIQAHRESNKWDTIPDDYFNNLISCLTKVMDNESAQINDRGISSMIIILSQTGLRNGEICDIPINSLETLKILNGTKTAYHLRYKTTKGVKGNGNYKEVSTVMTDLACRAYYTLENIYAKRREEINSDLLFVPLNTKTLPVTENTLSRMLVQICLKHGKEIGCINVNEKYPTLHHRDIGTIMDRKELSYIYLKDYKPIDTISIPRTHQFRVKLCNELINQGVSIFYVQKHMNHLKKEITYSYLRQEQDLAQEKEYAESVMKMLVTGETEIMGEGKETLMLRINEYIDKSTLNVSTNLDTIISELTKEIPIRAKVGGICIKSGPIRECGKSDKTDDLFCAFGMCNNLFHSFYMIDINYQKYTNLLKTIKYNQEKGFNKAAVKEVNKLKWIAEKYLLPELFELKKEIETKGEAEIKEKYPQVSFFIDNYQTIYEEVNAWLT
ncbi:tyrosine-type recombinase/integrase [Psychrobacillus sp. MER TA 171]|uniref:tyrosine-type recombinase/integrase n=1 Tax=Psychrobacillus sp. MER TA 171 TaxID=2939577 RepID=UPI002040763B|nr:tyrosine-type recombinase/integrase [Psychrobacillus sp. MER TA 171]MCM3359531.1 site-specific integrase [Psychrobacillus sp. MER TA 171]